MSVNTKMTAIADEIRELSGTTGAMGLDAMANYVGSANDEVVNQEALLVQIAAALEGKAIGGSGGEQATPIITINSTNGLITATAGTKSSTLQLAFQPAKTITPSATSQIAVSSGYYTGGNITVAGDPNLIAGNIKSGVSIFGVSGTLEESSGDSEVIEDAFIARNIGSAYINNRVKSIGSFAFAYCSSLTSVSFLTCTTINYAAFSKCTSLTSVNFPVCTTIDNYAFCDCIYLSSVNFPACISINYAAFSDCYNLTSVSFPACTTIGYCAFERCTYLTSVNFPACTYIGDSAFRDCAKLMSINFPVCTSIQDRAFMSCSSLTTASFLACTRIGYYAFYSCYRLSSLTLGASIVCTLNNSSAFSYTPFAGYSAYFSGTPHIYVPASLVDAYKSATNWTYFSSYITAIENMEA